MSINKSEIRASAEEFLREARELIADDRVILVPRQENKQWMEELEITYEQVWEIIERL